MDGTGTCQGLHWLATLAQAIGPLHQLATLAQAISPLHQLATLAQVIGSLRQPHMSMARHGMAPWNLL
jgi:hypothetical protein